ncbi:hypothetical protein Q1695_003284 [Nippostrongylus brasiliensis]|nr:hypothetical protein Q1695_003284 [Nippostrongylus brasiliensis]
MASPCLECEKAVNNGHMNMEHVMKLFEQMKCDASSLAVNTIIQQPQEYPAPNAFLELLAQYLRSRYYYAQDSLSTNSLGSEETGVSSSTPSLSSSCESFDTEPVMSRKVFVGGLPQDISKYSLLQKFSSFGRVHLDFPSEPTHPPRSKRVDRKLSTSGYVFVVFESEVAVLNLLQKCVKLQGNFFLLCGEDSKNPKLAQVRPWYLSSITYAPRPQSLIDPRLTVFIGGVPRPIAAQELGSLLEKNFGELVYCEIDVEPELFYPKGAARAVFASYSGYIRAIQTRFLEMPNFEFNKRNVEIKPYIMENAECDECLDSISDQYCRLCLQYYCQKCWEKLHHIVDHTRRQSHCEYTVEHRRTIDADKYFLSKDLLGALEDCFAEHL